ncbi:MAG: hypothetical protein HOH86_03995 [Verrucomicrobiales bacterium]|nr:hypothetical protein [Verrucomicrobiales bacterium]
MSDVVGFSAAPTSKAKTNKTIDLDQNRFITLLIFPGSWFLRNTGKRRLSFCYIQIKKSHYFMPQPYASRLACSRTDAIDWAGRAVEAIA